MYDLLIIGAGPAGLTAALYAGRSRLETLILEKLSCGGRILMSETIDNFPGFPTGVSTQELMQRMKEQVDSLGIRIALEEVLELDCKTKSLKTDENNYSAKAVIIATGAIPRKLNVAANIEFSIPCLVNRPNLPELVDKRPFICPNRPSTF